MLLFKLWYTQIVMQQIAVNNTSVIQVTQEATSVIRPTTHCPLIAITNPNQTIEHARNYSIMQVSSVWPITLRAFVPTITYINGRNVSIPFAAPRPFNISIDASHIFSMTSPDQNVDMVRSTFCFFA